MSTLLLLAVLSQEAGPPVAPPPPPPPPPEYATPPVAQVEEPSSGLGLVITGSVLIGVGGLNLAISPVCVTDFYRNTVGATGSKVCLYASLIAGGALFLSGIPLLIVGLMRRSEHRAWEAQQPVTFNVYFDGRLAYAALRFDLERLITAR